MPISRTRLGPPPGVTAARCPKARPAIGVFRHTLLPPSETFIAEQAAHIRGFEVHFFGREAGTGQFELPRRHLVCRGKDSDVITRALYTLTGCHRGLLEKMRAVRPVLLHAHFGVEGCYALRFARILGIPLITTFWGYDATMTRRSLITSGKIALLRYALIRPSLRRYGHRFIAVSKYIRRRLIKLGFDPTRVVLHYIGTDTRRFSPSPHDQRERSHIVTVGRLVEKKGTEFLLRAFHHVKVVVPEARLTIVGDGPLRERLTRLVHSLKLDDCVQFAGTLAHSAVADLLRRATIFTLPSITAHTGDAEGLPNVVLEAAASGVPVVATRHSGIVEAVIDQETGFLVPERDAESLSHRLVTLLQNEDLRWRMGAAARAYVKQHFDIGVQTRKLEEMYHEVIDEHQRRITSAPW
ncbi:MAG: glycosyltransferase [Planctomycetes bacterium]|nr:glycosyltransferase [Planctomycetota bacterium]